MLFLSFTASWCAECAPFVQMLKERYPTIELIEVEAEKSPLSELYNVTGYPTTFVFDAEGDLLLIARGNYDYENFDALLNRAKRFFSLGGTDYVTTTTQV